MDFLPAPSWCLLQVACVGCLRMGWWTSGVAAVGGSPSGGATTGLAACWWWYSHYGSASSPSALGGLLDLSKRVNGSGCLNLSVACVYSAGHGWLAALSWATCTGLATCCCFSFTPIQGLQLREETLWGSAAVSWRNSREVGGLGSGRCRLLMGTKSKDADFVGFGHCAARWMGGLQLSGGKLVDWRWLAFVQLHLCSVVRHL